MRTESRTGLQLTVVYTLKADYITYTRALKYPPHCPNGSVEMEVAMRVPHTDTSDGYMHTVHAHTQC